MTANTAAGEYIEYTGALIAYKRRAPDGLLVSELVRVEDDGDTLTEDEDRVDDDGAARPGTKRRSYWGNADGCSHAPCRVAWSWR